MIAIESVSIEHPRPDFCTGGAPGPAGYARHSVAKVHLTVVASDDDLARFMAWIRRTQQGEQAPPPALPETTLQLPQGVVDAEFCE